MKMRMTKRVRLTVLTLAGFLAFLAAARTSRAGCTEACWVADDGRICCTTETCYDYCF